MFRLFCIVALTFTQAVCVADAPKVFVWPDLAPGETSLDEGTAQPLRSEEVPPVNRIVGIRRPTIDVFPAQHPNGSAVLVLPGGGFGKVVPDKEGSEVAPWLNKHGISVFVLRYRTNENTPKSEPAWLRQRPQPVGRIRQNATKWKLDSNKVGVLGFSAGGQVASILHTRDGITDYQAVDSADELSSKPDFSLLIYPWQILDESNEKLLAEIKPAKSSPPAFIVHTHDDRSSALGSVLVYAGLKQHNVPAELHVYANGGHGYGMRSVANSEIGTWPDRATAWLKFQRLADN